MPALADWVPQLLIATCLVVFVLGVKFMALWQRWRRARTGTHYQQRGALAERQAEHLLEGLGYRIKARQARATYTYRVDDEMRTANVQADLLVRSGKQLWAAEVKTGDRGRRIGHAPTRRQLLEYQLAFRVAGVLLVDPTAGHVECVSFPLTPRPPWALPFPLRAALWLATAAGLAAAWHGLPDLLPAPAPATGQFSRAQAP